jgi:hypothetical protein
MALMHELKAAKVADNRTYFAKKWLKNGDGTSKVTFGSLDRSAIRAFLNEPPTQTYNPGGTDPDGINIWEATLDDIRQNLESGTDDEALMVNLLLLYKAVRRG